MSERSKFESMLNRYINAKVRNVQDFFQNVPPSKEHDDAELALRSGLLDYVHWLEANTPVDKLSNYGMMGSNQLTNKDEE